jgi:hypothetical protein
MQKEVKEKKLLFSVGLNDCEIKAVTASCKAGGSGKDTSNTKVQLLHRPSGVETSSQEQRSQFQNKKEAFLKLANHPKFRNWLKLEASRLMGQPSIESIVDSQMTKNNIKIEIKDENGLWKEISFVEFEQLQKDGKIV